MAALDLAIFLKNQRLSNIQVQYLRENGEKCCIGFKWNDALGKCLRKYSVTCYIMSLLFVSSTLI